MPPVTATMEFLYRKLSTLLAFIHGGVPHQRRAETQPARQSWRTVAHLVRVVAALESNSYQQEHAMMDVIVLGLGVVFFAATIAYAYACDRL